MSAYREKHGEGLVAMCSSARDLLRGDLWVVSRVNGKKLPAEDKLVEKLLKVELEKVVLDGEVSPVRVSRLCKRKSGKRRVRGLSAFRLVLIKKDECDYGAGNTGALGQWVDGGQLRVLNAADFGVENMEGREREGKRRSRFRISPCPFIR